MQRFSPPLTLADFVNKSNACQDPDFSGAGGLDSCVENPLGDNQCAKPFLDTLWVRFGDILTHIGEIDGYLGRNSYTHRTDSTGGTYTFGGNYDVERSLYTSPSTINWGWKCVGLDGKKYYDSAMFATTTLIHEGIPGHQAQLPLQGELTCQVSNLTASTAWFEGWGLWSEGLGFVLNRSDAQPLGLYQNPVAEAGRWNANLLRTGRLVVDTRLHSLGNMSYLDCANYYGAIGVGYDYGLYECSRYITMPAQALAYWLGKNQFQKLVDIVTDGLGGDFDYREFLMVVSKFGGLGLFSDLDRIIRTYVLWKQKDPAAITSFGYKFFVNDFYRQAAPVVAKGGKDISFVTAISPAKKRSAEAALSGRSASSSSRRSDMPTMTHTKPAPILSRVGYKLRPRVQSKRSVPQNARKMTKGNRNGPARQPTPVDALLKRFKPSARFSRLK
jgi:hypothetical protein